MARYYQTKANDGGGADSITPTKEGADEFNSIASEVTNSVVKSGQTPAAADGTSEIFTQMATAMFINGISAQTVQDSGIADAYIVTPVTGSTGLVVPTNYSQMNGAILTFIPSAANTGASTLDFGQTTGTLLGAKNILDIAGDPLASGALDTTNYHEFLYSTSVNAWIFIGKKRTAALYDAYGKWSEFQLSGVDGGDFTAGVMETRVLNRTDENDSNIAVLAGNQLTQVKPGKYIIRASCPGFDVQEHAAWLQDITGAALLVNGTSEDCGSGANQSRSFINGPFELTVESTIEIQHECTATQAGSGLGSSTGIVGREEIYTIIELERRVS